MSWPLAYPLPDSFATLVINNTALPAAGAFTASSYLSFPNGRRRMTVITKYTKNASATTGQFKLRVMWQFAQGAPPAGVAITGCLEGWIDTGNITVSEPEAGVKGYGLDILGPQFTTGTAVSWQNTLEIPAGATAAVAQLAEIGDTAHPGTVSQYLSFSRRSASSKEVIYRSTA